MPAGKAVRAGGKRTGRQILLRLAFLVYGVAMLWLLFGQRLDEGIHFTDYAQQLKLNINLEPLRTIKLYRYILENSQNNALLRHAFINLVGNVVMFVPLGFFLPYLWKRQRNLFMCLLTGMLLIIGIEVTQFFSLLGCCDVDDLILNMAGILLGYLCWKLFPPR
jgi:glycopeptide antibiotics resistance protein